MKTINRLLIIAGLLTLSCATYVQAEEKPATTGVHEKPIKQKSVFTINISEGTLERAIQDIENIWIKSDEKASINIIVHRDAKANKMDSMILRNVTGPQAILLVSTAAGCKLQELFPPDAGRQRVTPPVGYYIYPNSTMKQNQKPTDVKKTAKNTPSKKKTHTISLQNLEPNTDLDSLIQLIMDLNGWNDDDLQIAVHKPLGILILRGSTDACQTLERAILVAIRQDEKNKLKTAENRQPEKRK